MIIVQIVKTTNVSLQKLDKIIATNKYFRSRFLETGGCLDFRWCILFGN